MTKRLLTFFALVVAFSVLVAGLAAGCSGTVTPAGLVIIFKTDGTLPQATRLHYEISSFDDGKVFVSADKYIPSEVQLPTTLSIDSSENPAASVLINTSLWDDTAGTLLDDRENQIIDIPTTRVSELTIVFSAKCTPLAQEEPGGTAAGSTCNPGYTCNPLLGACTDGQVNASTLPSFDGGVGTTFADASGPPGSGADATMSDGSTGGEGEGGALDGGPAGEAGAEASTVPPTPGGRVFVLEVGTAETANDAHKQATLDIYSTDGALVQSVALPTVPGAGSFSIGIGSTGALALGAAGDALYVAGQNTPPGSQIDDDAKAVIYQVSIAATQGTSILAPDGVFAGLILYSATADVSANYYLSTGDGVFVTDGGSAATLIGGSSTSALQLAYVQSTLFASSSEGLEMGAVTYSVQGGATGFVLFDTLDGGTPDTAYVTNSNGIIKLDLVGGTGPQPLPGLPSGETPNYVTGVIDGTNVTLFATTVTGDAVYRVDDSTGGGFSRGGPTVFATPPPLGGAFRGIVYVPD